MTCDKKIFESDTLLVKYLLIGTGYGNYIAIYCSNVCVKFRFVIKQTDLNISFRNG